MITQVPITPEKVEYRKQANHGHSRPRGVQQRLAWKEKEQEKKERKQQKKAARSAQIELRPKTRPQPMSRFSETAFLNGSDESNRRHSAAPTNSQKDISKDTEKVSHFKD